MRKEDIRMTSGSANDRLEGAFLELIEEKPYSKITVNHIVERAGVHRNTFYYHYQSIPVMLGEICRKMVTRMFEIYKDAQSPSDCVLPLVRYSKSHRDAILHVYDSDARPILMEYVHQISKFAIESFIDNVTEKTGIPKRDKDLLARFYTAGLVGVWTEWVEDGMQTDSSEDFIRIGNVLTKMTLEAYRS
jgi:AcrR family transcriptional regulator